MGFKNAAVLAPVSFFLGIYLICFNVDHRLLWKEMTEEVMKNAEEFYTTFYNSPPAIKALLHGMMGVGLVGLVSKLHAWDESAMVFDGSCLAAYVTSIAIYLTVTVPSLREIVEEAGGKRGVETREKLETMRVLAAGNVIVVILLGAILALQAAQEFASRLDSRTRWEYSSAAAESEQKQKKEQ